MKRARVTPIELSEEQEMFFIDTWENNRCDTARVILHDKLGLGLEPIRIIAQQLRKEGKIRNKRERKFSDKEALAFKEDYENGRTLKEIAEAHHVGVKLQNARL